MVDKAIADRFENVLAKADQARETARSHQIGDTADSLLLEQWRSQSLTLLRSLFPEDHPYVTGFVKGTEDFYSDRKLIDRGKGVLLAAQEDFERGYLWSLKERVHADVFDDYLDMAVSFVADGYKDAAAVIAGSTLEEHLRMLCQKNNIPTTVTKPNGSTEPKKASAMNVELRTQGVYNQLEWRQVDAWLDIRNKAAHGEYSEYTQQQVEQMIDGIRGFFLRNPA